jgi:hypothetical protein
MSINLIRTAEALAAEIRRRVALCTVAQGAETDLAATVYEGRRHVSDDMIPCATIIEGTDVASMSMAGTLCDTNQTFVVYAWVRCDPSHPNLAARAAIRDLKRALFRTNDRADATWGRTVKSVRYLGKDIGPRADGASYVVAAIEFNVEFVEDLSAP